MLSVDFNVTGDLLAALNRPAEAMETYRKDLAIALKIAAVDPGNAEWQHDLWLSYYRLGQKQAEANQPEAAGASSGEATTIIEKLVASRPDNAAWQKDLVATLVALAPFSPDALDYYKRALVILQRLDAEGRLPTSKKGWISILQRGIESLQK
jgi:tetratricopeptide (TPR) repeat protein